MNIAFTICSNNYLAQAKVLRNSINKYGENFKFVIGLCDEKSDEIDYSSFQCEIVEMKDIGIKNFDDLWMKYDIIEFNTSVKASFFKYLLSKNPNTEFIYYFDPDIEILDQLSILNAEFENNVDILLTPHILSSIPLDGYKPVENTFLNFGIYNLGFIGLRGYSENAKNLLDWWEERLLSLCYNQPEKGLFVDQIWMNFSPIFFKKVKVLNKMGYNAAPWNLHERIGLIAAENNKYLMPDNSPLVFYHFSNFKYKNPETLAKYYDRYSLENSNSLKKLYQNYYQKIIENDIERISKIDCKYVILKNDLPKKSKSFYEILKSNFNNLLKIIYYKIRYNYNYEPKL
ncbi:hypothetical protein [Chryseobacterium candidae]|uniref:Glycosyl transferase n=1 Tax=Chryseobacterium candidae TaxID=1978493 RepID=A0ABY2RC41_9FLAO|nr:hypothetical protein [Chryseobacterium candidae]THV63128.1 hypothetical protein EK417_01770 [Chryseobacterium candidae]